MTMKKLSDAQKHALRILLARQLLRGSDLYPEAVGRPTLVALEKRGLVALSSAGWWGLTDAGRAHAKAAKTEWDQERAARRKAVMRW